MLVQSENQVMLFTWTQNPCNDTEYLLKLTGSLLGDSQAQFELSSYWTSVAYFEILLPCGSFYVATVESRNAAGTSNSSAPLNGTTGRLHFKHMVPIPRPQYRACWFTTMAHWDTSMDFAIHFISYTCFFLL